jgi:methylthioribulose-1-phosphate dehydratase
MARTKHNKPSGRGPPKDGISHKQKRKRKAIDAELEENGDGVPPKRKAGIEDVLQNSSSDVSGPDALVKSSDPMHPANHICKLCRNFYDHGWVTGTGGGVSIKDGNHIFIAPSGVQKELMRSTDIFVMDFQTQAYLRRPAVCPPRNLLVVAVTY